LFHFCSTWEKSDLLSDFFKAISELTSLKPSSTFDLENQYSNVGAALLGLTIAKIESKGYEQTLFEQVIRPMGLIDTSIGLSDEQKSRFIDGHDLHLKKLRKVKSKVSDSMTSALIFSHRTQVSGKKLDIGLS
jgi:CubicO group peptidase (beta-lactamase class C family)